MSLKSNGDCTHVYKSLIEEVAAELDRVRQEAIAGTAEACAKLVFGAEDLGRGGLADLIRSKYPAQEVGK